jgi:hypothetical protein
MADGQPNFSLLEFFQWSIKHAVNCWLDFTSWGYFQLTEVILLMAYAPTRNVMRTLLTT